MKLTCRQQKLVTEKNLYSVRENLKNLCSYCKKDEHFPSKCLNFSKKMKANLHLVDTQEIYQLETFS